MSKSATDVMQEVLVAAVLDSIAALKSASKGLPNTLMRDLNAIHANTTLTDLPKELQDSIAGNVRAAFTRLLREGYAVAPRDTAPRPAPAPFRREPRPDRKPPRGPGRGGPSKPRR